MPPKLVEGIQRALLFSLHTADLGGVKQNVIKQEFSHLRVISEQLRMLQSTRVSSGPCTDHLHAAGAAEIGAIRVSFSGTQSSLGEMALIQSNCVQKGGGTCLVRPGSPLQ